MWPMKSVREDRIKMNFPKGTGVASTKGNDWRKHTQHTRVWSLVPLAAGCGLWGAVEKFSAMKHRALKR